MEGDAEFHAQLLHTLRLPALPRVAGGLNWVDTFDVLPESEAFALLERLQSGRSHVVAALGRNADDRAPPDVVQMSNSLLEYLPEITAVLESLDRQGKVVTRKALSFEWAGSFGEAPSLFKCLFIIFELCMVLHSLGVLSYVHGANLVALANSASVDALPLLKDASKAFLASAAYFRCLGAETLPRWVRRDGLTRFPPELDEHVAMAFAHLGQAAAQQCSVVAAALGKTKHSLMAKLCAAVVQEAEDCLRCLQAADPRCERVSRALPTQAAYLRELFGSLALLHLGQDLAEANKCGDSIATIREGVASRWDNI